MTDEKAPLERAPDANTQPPIPPQQAIPRDPQHRQPPAGKRAPFLPVDHVLAKHHLKPGD